MTKGKTSGRTTYGNEPKHTYPSNYPPGCHWAVTAAWEVLDFIRVGAITDDNRAVLAGMISGRLVKERERAARLAEQGRAPHVARAIRNG